jgi:hypothetical protein
MKKIDSLFLWICFGAPVPVLTFAFAFLTWYFLFRNNESLIPYFIIPGFLAGVLFDILFLKTIVMRAPDYPLQVLAGLYILYSILIYGFWMGFPVPNLIMGPIAAYYMGIRTRKHEIPAGNHSGLIRSLSRFSALVMLVICILTAMMGLHEENIGLTLRNMFRLGFDVTRAMVWLLIIIGGSGLVIIEYFLTKFTLQALIRHSEKLAAVKE